MVYTIWVLYVVNHMDSVWVSLGLCVAPQNPSSPDAYHEGPICYACWEETPGRVEFWPWVPILGVTPLDWLLILNILF